MNNFNVLLRVFLTLACGAYCERFYYFAYGSNLLGRRLKINSPSAEFDAVAVLNDNRLDFNLLDKYWNGAVATIVETPGAVVYGDLWTLDIKDLPNLDRQEGVDAGWYFAKNVTVTTLDGREVVARTYQETHNPPLTEPWQLPYERQPSSTYLEVLVFDAVESGIPSDYIGYLISFPSNGGVASDDVRKALGYPFGPK